MKRRESTARRRLQPGKARNFISYASDEIAPGDKVVLWLRVSTHPQNRTGNLEDQEANLRLRMVELNAVVMDVVKHEGSGCELFRLTKAAQIAAKYGAKLVAESTDRFIRHPGYHSKEYPDLQARDVDLKELPLWTDGVKLVTILDPEATPAEVRSYQSKRGQKLKNNRGGRPRVNKPDYKKRRRFEKLSRVIRLWECGTSYRKIEELTGVPKSTAKDWILKYANECTVFRKSETV
jgi:hypothetical protein